MGRCLQPIVILLCCPICLSVIFGTARIIFWPSEAFFLSGCCTLAASTRDSFRTRPLPWRSLPLRRACHFSRASTCIRSQSRQDIACREERRWRWLFLDGRNAPREALRLKHHFDSVMRVMVADRWPPPSSSSSSYSPSFPLD